MILQIFNNQKKFSKGYFKMLQDHGWDMKQFHLIHFGEKEDYFEQMGIKTIFISSFFSPDGLFKLYREMKKADRIVIHSLAAPFLLLLLWWKKEFAGKAYWVIWGKDLYFYHSLKKIRFYHRAYEYIRKKAIKNIRHVTPILHGDYELLCEWYDIDAKETECNSLYPYALEFGDEDLVFEDTNQKKKTVLLGNSASKTNNHIDALNRLALCKEQIDKIYCPLSYNGKKKYVDQVLDAGRKLFGSQFIGLTDFLPKDEYFSMMESVDIGYFNYDRQEGLGNIYSLILKGKTVFLRGNTSSSRFFGENGIQTIDILKEGSELNVLSAEIRKRNRNLLKPLIDVEASLRVWKQILT